MKQTFSFLVCYHKDTPRLNNGVFRSIHVGRALSSAPLDETIGDDVGDNISNKNRNFCELTAIYWMLKNVDAEYYGLFHYRRLLNFSGLDRGDFHVLSTKTQNQFGWTKAGARAICEKFDVVTGPRWNVHPIDVPTLPMSNYDFYCREHKKSDIDITLDVVRERSQEVYPFVSAYMQSMTCFYGNVFVMRGDLFRRYADWLFDILLEVERRTDISGYDAYQSRVYGFLAERLMGAFIDYLAATGSIRIGQLPMVHGHFDKPRISIGKILANILRRRREARARPAIEPIHVAMLVDDDRAAQAAVALRSAVDLLPQRQFLHVHLVVDGHLSLESRHRLQTFLGPAHRVDLVEPGPIEDVYPRPAQREDRLPLLTLQDILPDSVRRVLVLGHDTLVLDGLDRLWSLSLQGGLAAACQHEGGLLHARRLNFPSTAGYFDAGVMVLDLERLRAEGGRRLFREAFESRERVIIRGATDVLNIAFLDRYCQLDLRWNVSDRFYRRNDLECRYSFKAACEAAIDPAIVQFTGDVKPQHRRSRHPLSMLYWHFLGRTPWTPSHLKLLRRVVRSTFRAFLRST